MFLRFSQFKQTSPLNSFMGLEANGVLLLLLIACVNSPESVQLTIIHLARNRQDAVYFLYQILCIRCKFSFCGFFMHSRNKLLNSFLFRAQNLCNSAVGTLSPLQKKTFKKLSEDNWLDDDHVICCFHRFIVACS